MSGGEEIELKLGVDPADLAALVASGAFMDHDPATRDQVSVYFDSAARDLHAAGLSLRIRTSGGRRIQTIKTESRGAASLFARGEWEQEVPSGEPVLDDVAALLPHGAEAAALAIAPAFTVEVNRTAVVRQAGASRIEMVADQGRVIAGEREQPIAEVELELLDGEKAALFELARGIADRVPVRIGVQSKSERGYALLAGEAAPSIKAEPIRLTPDLDTVALFEIVAGSCFRQFRLNEDKLLATGAPEALHQARVGLRRLRSALSIFKPLLEGPELTRLQDGLRGLAAALGRVRDVDVMIAAIDDEETLQRLHAARAERLEAAIAALGEADTGRMLLDFVEWVAIGEWRTRPETAERRAEPALVTACHILDRLRRRIKRGGKNLAKLSEHDRHQVRIAGKKLRYAAEFFAGLWQGSKAKRRREAFLQAIEDLQGALGHLNDLAAARTLFEELGIGDRSGVIKGRKASPERLLAEAEDAFERLVDVKPYWR